MSLPNIWPNDLRIPIIGVTGKLWSGKTLFQLMIDPEHTRIYDCELSSSTYTGIGAEIISVPEVLQEKYGEKRYTDRQAFEWWKNDIQKIKPGQFSVVGIDPASDIEQGMTDWVESRYSEFGFSSAAKFVSTGGIFWSKVKSEWKKLLVELATKVQTFTFSVHLKQVWKHGKPTDKLAPKGKSTLMELATLYMHLEREEDNPIPAGIVLKSRLTNITKTKAGVKIATILPPRLPRATAEDIRNYILNPPDYSKLKEEEQVQERALTADDKLELAKETAEAQKEAAHAALEVEKLKEKQEGAKKAARDRLRPNAEKVVEVEQEVEEEDKPVKDLHTIFDPITDEEADLLIEDAQKLKIFDKVILGIKKSLDARQVAYQDVEVSPKELTREEFDKFRARLNDLLSQA